MHYFAIIVLILRKFIDINNLHFEIATDKKESRENIVSKQKKKISPVLSGLISMIFDVMKHFLKDFENMRKIRKIDRVGDNFSTLEHLMVRLEDKLETCRKQIDELKNKLIITNIVIIILLFFIIYKLIT